ncbi:hypothetical protein [Pantanalinema sp. GBBB05]|uniref:hypothetical protein n=1 Tax=Pantanalinema sp. GBBB05 TaxID=2604139 RepID=UPI001D1F5B0F|nr:hypothetical protein [Pantanalinema sp. GBBB05]
MNDHNLIDFAQTIEWNLVARQTYLVNDGARVWERLPAKEFLIENSNVLIIGLSASYRRSTWYTGAWASQMLFFLPSSTSIFPAIVQHRTKKLRLGIQNLVVFPKVLSPWLLQLNFPYWLQDITVEIWRYDGRDESVFDHLNRVESKLDAL